MAFDYKPFIKTLPLLPGIYQMFDENGAILYVGKAKNLKNRVSSYFSGRPQNGKTAALVKRIASIQITVTPSEAEALILEHNLIKQQRPPYNILLRDDKSYPYILLSNDEFPRLSLHRGARKIKGHYFGPYPNAYAAREALALLQKVFQVRQCENVFYNNRSRPCLQYQIKRCKAPCVGLVERGTYMRDVERTEAFLKGRNSYLLKDLAKEMDEAATELEYEKAARLRDQIRQLREVQSQQVIEKGRGDVDVIAAACDSERSCVHMLFIRNGRIIGSRSFYPTDALASTPAEVVSSFVPHFYLGGGERQLPREIVIQESIEDKTATEAAIGQLVKHKVTINVPARGRKFDWLHMARNTAEQNLAGKQASSQSYRRRMDDLQSVLGFSQTLERLECYDISHTQGELTVASCVVFDTDGPNKTHYRRFNIDGITGGDDYAAMRQVLQRRFGRLVKEDAVLPDLVIIDGGKGQLGIAIEVMNELAVSGVELLGIAKGPARKSGWERLFVASTGHELTLDSTAPAFHLLQQIRDEAHRFAITGHKARRGKKMTESPLDQIEGIGPKRKRELLRHFGGLQGVKKASEVELAKAEGVSSKIATEVYRALHNQ